LAWRGIDAAWKGPKDPKERRHRDLALAPPPTKSGSRSASNRGEWCAHLYLDCPCQQGQIATPGCLEPPVL